MQPDPASSYPWERPCRAVSFSAPLVIGKQRPRHTRSGHVYTPARTKRAEKMIRDAYTEAAQAEGIREAPEGWPVAIVIAISKRLPKSAPKRVRAQTDLTKPDLDNVAKLVLDALNGAAYKDDRQVVELRVSRTLRVRDVPSEALYVTVMTPAYWAPKIDNYL